MKKILKFSVYLTIVIAITLLATLMLLFASVKDYNFQESKLISSSQTFEFYSDNNNLISKRTANSKSEFIELKKLKNYTKNAFIAIEDRRFYSHNGIDYKRIISASIKNLKSMSFKEGASTITQQLVKNTHLSSEKTVKRKMAEIKIARQIEKEYTKDEILEFYLNTIYFGKGAYGIEDAAKTYFNKSSTALTLNESAMLAGIIKSPAKYSPFNNYELANDRKNVVLKAMKDCDFISNDTYLKNKKLTVSLNENSNVNYYDNYLNAVIQEYENSDAFAPYNFSTVKIYTFLNEELQEKLFELEDENFNTSKIIINSKNHGVIAYNENISNIKRCPASTVKPWLIYAPMINDKYIKESTVIKDETININGYSPKNYNNQFYGNVTVKTALSKSLNVPAVKLLNDYGINNVNKYTLKMGLDVSNETLPIALGALNKGLTIKELCDNYSTFNNNGNYTKSSFIKKIYVNGFKVYEFNPKTTSIFTSETAYIINDILKESVLNGTSKKLRSLPYEICAKTGTNGNESGNLDAISVSYTTENIVGVWCYPKNNSPMPNSISGSTYPTAVSEKIYNELYKNGYKPKNFDKPSGIIQKQINETELLKSEVELLSENGTNYYYIKGTEPTESENNYLKPTINNLSIELVGNIVQLKFSHTNGENVVITRNINGNKTTVYSGIIKPNFIDKLNNFGVYEYEITIINNYGQESKKFNKIKYDYINLFFN